jgi:integrase
VPAKLTETKISKTARDAAEDNCRLELADAACPGLRLRFTPAGAKTWALACRDRMGRMRRFSLGSYPNVGLAEARDEARSLRVKVRDEGADPTAERKRDRAIGRDAKAGKGTLAAVIDLYQAGRGKDLKSWAAGRKTIDRVFADLLPKPVATLSAVDLQMAADAYLAKPSAALAVRTLRPVLKWAATRNHAPARLAALQADATKPRERVLGREELARLLPVLRASDKPHAGLLRFLLLTLARLNEASRARLQDIDMEARTWTIHETKNGQPHIVPLSSQAILLLRDRLPDKKQGNTLVFATSTGKPLGNWDRECKALMDASKTKAWHRHDLRRTGATMLGDLGETPDIIEAALNHVAIRSRLAATYNRSRYRPQVAAALQKLADSLDGIGASGMAKAP